MERLEQSVVEQLVSDVPLGAFLSGGVDSSSIVALMARHTSQPVKTYSIGFAGRPARRKYACIEWIVPLSTVRPAATTAWARTSPPKSRPSSCSVIASKRSSPAGLRSSTRRRCAMEGFA